MLNKEEKQVLRTLAAQYAEAAALPVQQEKASLAQAEPFADGADDADH